MHDIRWIREHAAEFDKALNRRPLDAESKKQFSSANLLAIDERRRAAILKSEQAQARRNAASKEIGAAKAKKDEAAAQALMAEVNELKVTLPTLEQEAKAAEEELNKILATIPNLPLGEVPEGRDETGNVEHHQSRREAQLRVQAEGAFRAGRSARDDGFRDGGEIVRLAVRGAEKRPRADGTRAWAVHARCAHARAWLHRGQSAAVGAK